VREGLDELWNLVRQIPPGCCASYGDLGQALRQPASGYQVGRWMANCPEDVPWWRVVAKTGALPVHKRDPAMAARQQQLLEAEGVAFTETGVDMDECRWLP
jgi:methylated-DNA-protein-cysteine methyltransferase related protein